ncbi:hypothetical protein [Chitinophaga arvensicola]|nr:hypothetical protein [Chitinophaga arvensicola]
MKNLMRAAALMLSIAVAPGIWLAGSRATAQAITKDSVPPRT